MIDVPRETSDRLHRFAELLVEENDRQNLIAKSTLDDLWRRHIDDAAQLTAHDKQGATWLDIGSGAGLPGVVIAILTGNPTILVEPRRLRADFLSRAVTQLGLNATVIQSKAENVQSQPVDIITARAVASVERLFGMALHLSHKETKWVLPKGRSAQLELEEAKKTWQGDFRLEPSRTDPEAQILIATNVRRKSGARGVA